LAKFFGSKLFKETDLMKKQALCVVAGCLLASLGIFSSISTAANPPLPKGVTEAMVTQGGTMYKSQTCVACHGATGAGTPLGPDLTDNKWIWSDGGYPGIVKTIKEGVPKPKQFQTPMPPMGGAQLTPDQVSALAAYIWSLSHH
jgi:mono/diheme cytochrome c family protein